jgi:hypothetical protein
MSINRAAYEGLGKPEGVVLLWDGEHRVIAMRPEPLTNQNAYPLRPQGPNSTEKGPWLIAGTLFTQFIGLDTSEAYRWTPTFEDGMLILDISKPGSKATSNRRRAGQQKAHSDEGSQVAESRLPCYRGHVSRWQGAKPS